MFAKTMTITAGLFAVGLVFGLAVDSADAGGYCYTPVTTVVHRPVYVAPAPVVVRPAAYVNYAAPVYYHRPVYRTYVRTGYYRPPYYHCGRSGFGFSFHYRH